MPKFSIIIPTRQRSDTLRFALQTAVAQDFDDVEILVHESGDDPSTAEVVSQVGDQRTRHLKTVDPVPMSENWERAVAVAEGDYLTIIGDDDGIISTACSEAAAILDRYPVELVTWRPAAYFWPESAVTTLRNRLQSYLVKPSAFTLQDPHALLELAYHFRDHHYTMPMMLHSFVGREVVDRVRSRLGCYFYSALRISPPGWRMRSSGKPASCRTAPSRSRGSLTTAPGRGCTSTKTCGFGRRRRGRHSTASRFIPPWSTHATASCLQPTR
jgi:glycosyltransferase involved in cell wall biosynthesis